jgi:hypothetical protein
MVAKTAGIEPVSDHRKVDARWRMRAHDRDLESIAEALRDNSAVALIIAVTALTQALPRASEETRSPPTG